MTRFPSSVVVVAFGSLALAGCAQHSVVTTTSAGGTTTVAPAEAPNTPGAPTPRAALDRFLADANAQDIQAMSLVWGNEKGPVRDQMDRKVLEEREIIMQCYLSHDKVSIDGQSTFQANTIFDVTLSRGSVSRTTRITTVMGPDSRWYVVSADIQTLTDLCKQQQGQPAKKP